MTRDEALRAAGALVARSFAVFPIAVSYDDTKRKTNKRPLTPNGHLDATTDPDRVRQLFATARLRSGEELGVGMFPGSTVAFVVDCDRKPDCDGADTLHELEVRHGPLPEHPVILTPSGGVHHYFARPAATRIGNSHTLGAGIDIRGDDGWVVAPGTVTTWGRWTVDEATRGLPTPPAPAWMLQHLSTNGDRAGGRWRTLDPDSLDPRDVAALRVLEALGGHDPWLGPQGEIHITRPGKTSGTSATVGYVAPGIAKVFTSDWPPLHEGRVYDVDELARLADTDQDRVHVVVVSAEDFAAVDEEGAQPLLGEVDDVLIPVNGDVMVYGDGGAGKTTLGIDLAVHLATGTTWLDIPVPQQVNVLLVENEGPRPLFRRKLRRKLAAWTDRSPAGRMKIVQSPWATLTFAAETHRAELARQIAEHEADVVIVGPLASSGMNDAGTLQEVRAFLKLLADVRQRCGRPVTFILIHHEGKGGKVSGAWEGAGDSLLHVTGMGRGRTRLYVQKARWATSQHARTLELGWTDGEGFELLDRPEVSDDDLAEEILTAIGEHPGTGWKKAEDRIHGVSNDRKRAIRDRLLADGRIVNVVRNDGVEVALDHCPERRPCRLYPADDPTIAHLCRDSGTAPAQSVPPTGAGESPVCAAVPVRSKGTDGAHAPGRLDLDAPEDGR